MECLIQYIIRDSNLANKINEIQTPSSEKNLWNEVVPNNVLNPLTLLSHIIHGRIHNIPDNIGLNKAVS